MRKILEKLGFIVLDQDYNEQRNQVAELSEKDPRAKAIKQRMLDGAICNVLPLASGSFGKTETSPVPVNSNRGEIRYLNRLRCKCGVGLFFHRIESIVVEPFGWNVDVFETVCINGVHWDLLYLDLYHPARSKRAPKGYRIAAYNAQIVEMGLGFGTTLRVDELPGDLPDALEKQWGSMGKSLTRTILKLSAGHTYEPPAEHKQQIISIYNRVHFVD